jgi:hypothetical protein
VAPELIQNSAVDGRADLYSLGCVAYWLLTGQLVFPGENAMRVIADHLNKAVEPPSSRCELEIPADLEHLVMTCLEKAPEHRPASAEALSDSLSAVAIPRPWTEVRAAQWWQLHYPAKTGERGSAMESIELPGQLPSEQVSGSGDHRSESAAEAMRLPTPQTPPPRFEEPRDAEFALPRRTARALFLITQAGYLAMYFAALYQAEALQQSLYRAFLVPPGPATSLVVAFTMCSIAVRLYLFSSVGLDHPKAGANFRRLFPVLLLLDGAWASAPLLLVGKLGLGLPLFGVAALAYLPFSQRTLMQSIYPARAGKATASGTTPASSVSEASAQSTPPRPGP